METLVDHALGLDIVIHHDFLSRDTEETLFEEVKKIPWYRVKYLSERHNNHCETPCWTNFFGGVKGVKPYQPIPSVFHNILERVRGATDNVDYNAVLVRLYFDGNDNIAYHTDGRSFLGPEPIIASLSLGAAATFSLRKMNNVWPSAGTPHGGVDRTVPEKHLRLKGGSLLVMKGKTQQQWHHAVLKDKSRGPRININFRYILPGRDEITVRGVRAFYKYMVSGDAKNEDWDITAESVRYEEIVRRSRGPMFAFATTSSSKYSNQRDAIKSTDTSPSLMSSKFFPPTSAAMDTEIKSPLSGNNPDSEWCCPACTYLNAVSEKYCEICATRKPFSTTSVDSTSSSSEVPLDVIVNWECSSCTYINEKTTCVCEICGKSHTRQHEQKKLDKLVNGKRTLAQQNIASTFSSAKRRNK